TDGQTQSFTWNVSDASGLSALSIIITQDTGSGPVVIYSTTNVADAVGSFNFDAFGQGTFQIQVSATDADSDRAGDALSSSGSRSVTVTTVSSGPVQLISDPLRPGKQALLVTGTPGNDVIEVRRAGLSTTDLLVCMNGQSLGVFGPVTGRVIIVGGDGNDVV